jgi:23S rRNA (adenine2503-C2)-methyltransferase
MQNFDSSNLLHLSLKELGSLFESWGEPKFRARQVYEWIWKHRIFSFSEMSNLSKNLRTKLSADWHIQPPKIIRTEKSEDGTIKYLLSLSDFKTVETVWIPREDQGRVTVCISTQVGCKMGCKFCLTAQQKTERNLTAGEIASQILILPNFDQVTNVVVMGMGEPFDNYTHLMNALSILNDPHALGIGAGKITVSTSGLIPYIHRFAQESKCRLAVSLNAPNDEIRTQVMPINKAYPIKDLMKALKEIAHPQYPKLRKKDFTVTFEYILMEGINDRTEDAYELLKLVRGIPCKINLLLYNENPNTPYKRPHEKVVEEFQTIL